MAPLLVAALALVLAACGGGGEDATSSPTPTERSTVTHDTTPEPTPVPEFNEYGVRYCYYVPGESEPADMPREVTNPASPTPFVTITRPAQTSVSAETTEAQLDLLDAYEDVITETYVYPDFNGKDWEAIQAETEALVSAGLTDEDFYVAMAVMVASLGDDHSYFLSPAEVVAEDAEANEASTFVGIGVLAEPVGDEGAGTVLALYPDSPAAEAGLRPHDLMLTVDGEPVWDAEAGVSATLGEPGTTLELEFQRPGEDETRTVEITRRSVTGFTPVDYCIVPETRIGYIVLPTFSDLNVDDQVRDALLSMTMDGPLDGLVLDNRLNGGGSSAVLEPMLGYFTDGVVGQFVSRSGERHLAVAGEDIGGSQTVPLVILADTGTESYAEVFTGVLQARGRAIVVGGHTQGNVETLVDSTSERTGARLWLATETFAPTGFEPGLWEGVGITPDVLLPTRWDLFTEETDPALAEAVELLQE